VENDDEVDMSWQYEFSVNGLSELVSFLWSDNASITTMTYTTDNIYCGMLNMDAVSVTNQDYVQCLPDETKNTLDASFNNLGAQSAYIYLEDEPIDIYMAGFGPTKRMHYEASTQKTYLEYESLNLPGGKTPTSASNTVWNLGFRWDIRKRAEANEPSLKTGRSRYDY